MVSAGDSADVDIPIGREAAGKKRRAFEPTKIVRGGQPSCTGAAAKRLTRYGLLF